MALAMSIISKYEAHFNLFGEWICNEEELPVCPECQTPLKYRDSRRRHIRREGGKKYWGHIRRLFCKNCRRLHNELPANVSPHKHYKVEVIEGVVDEIVIPDDPENGPGAGNGVRPVCTGGCTWLFPAPADFGAPGK